MVPSTIIAMDVTVGHFQPEVVLCVCLALLVILCSLWKIGSVERSVDCTDPVRRSAARAADPRGVDPTSPVASADRLAAVPATRAMSVARAADVDATGVATSPMSVAGAADVDATSTATTPMSVARAADVDADNGQETGAHHTMPCFGDALPRLRSKKIQRIGGRLVRILQAPSPSCDHADIFNSAYNQWGWNVRCPGCSLMAHIRWASESEAKSAKKHDLRDIAERIFQS